MTELDRRRFLSKIGIGGSALTTLGTVTWSPTSKSHRPDLETIRKKLSECSRDAALTVAAGLVAEGATWQDLLGGVFMAGVHDIKPQPVGFQFHAVMMVESAFQLAAASPAEERLLPVFFNVADFKSGQARDRQRGDWRLTKYVEAESLRPALARKQLIKALSDRDEERADRAMVSLFRSEKPDDLFEMLWPLAAADFHNIGHKIIYTAHAYRTLQRIGWRYGQPVVRSLTLALLDGTGRDAGTQTLGGSRKLAESLPKRWRGGVADPDASVVVLQKLRSVSAKDAAGVIAELIGSGCTAASVWDGYRLYAGEMLLQRPGILPVHPTTSVNALHFGYRTSGSDATQRQLLLHGATYLALYRDFFAQRGRPRHQEEIDGLRPADSVTVTELLGDRDRMAAASGILAAPSSSFDEVISGIRSTVFQKGTEHHLYKYAAAVLEDVRSCHASIATRLLAAGMPYVPSSDRPHADIHRRTLQALHKGR